MPDSSQFYFDDLPGEKYLLYIPNTDHSLENSDALESLTAFYHAVVNNKPRPRFDWSFEDDGSIRVEPQDKPTAVTLWQAHNPRHRDFRLESVGPIYESSTLSLERDGSFVGRIETPEQGFTAFFVELVYPSGVKHPFKFTTGVRVLPGPLPVSSARTRQDPSWAEETVGDHRRCRAGLAVPLARPESTGELMPPVRTSTSGRTGPVVAPRHG